MINLLKKIFVKFATSQPVKITPTAQGTRVINGAYNISQSVLSERIQINGSASFGKNTRALDSITINGKLNSSGATFEDALIVNGTTILSQTQLKKHVQFSGTLNATDCLMAQDISLLTHNATFKRSRINRITVEQLPYIDTNQTIILQDGCVVTGDIIFKSGTGVVQLDKSSQIHGIVQGGRIVAS